MGRTGFLFLRITLCSIKVKSYRILSHQTHLRMLVSIDLGRDVTCFVFENLSHRSCDRWRLKRCPVMTVIVSCGAPTLVLRGEMPNVSVWTTFLCRCGANQPQKRPVKAYGCAPVKPPLRTLRFASPLIFTWCKGVFYFFRQPKNMKTIWSPRAVQKQVVGWICLVHGP